MQRHAWSAFRCRPTSLPGPTHFTPQTPCRYVLRRAIESADALNQECEGDAVGGAPEALQTALDGAGEEEEEEEVRLWGLCVDDEG